MPDPNVLRRMNRFREVMIAVAVILGIVFYSGFPEGSWHILLIFIALHLFLQSVSVSIDARSDISLGTAAILPMIFLLGATPAMFIGVVKGLYDGIRHKKEWRRTLFNAAQFSIAILLSSLSFEYLGKLLEGVSFGLPLAAALATVAYSLGNTGIVSYLFAISKGVSWWTELNARLEITITSSLRSGYIGIIFTFFVMSYGFWGLIAFSLLLINLSRLLQAAAEVSAERILRKELEEELVIDEMTGAYNFRYLNNWLNQPSDEKVSLLFMDIDDFAVFNNTYGHAEGDKVLRLLVDTISRSIRSGDHVVRYGGDEFVIFLRGMDAEGARLVAERIMSNLAAPDNRQWEEPITISLGIASKPEHTQDKRQLLLFADQAMYYAKGLGKNNIQMWSTDKDSA